MKLKNFVAIAVLALGVSCGEAYAIPDEPERFCKAWAQDAANGAEYKMRGASIKDVKNVFDNVPNHVLPPHAKERAYSAAVWAYALPVDMEDAYNYGLARCRACVMQHNPMPCMQKFDDKLFEYYLGGGNGETNSPE